MFFRDRIHIRESVFGMVMGGIIYGPVAGTTTNLSVAIACGTGVGLISALYFAKIYPWVNENSVYDSAGVLLMLTLSVLGACLVNPIVLWLYDHYNTNLATLQADSSSSGDVIPSRELAYYSLSYPAISALIGSGSGIVIGLVMKCLDSFD